LKKSFVHIFHMGMIGLLLALVCSNCTFVNKLIDRDKDFYVHQVKWEGETLSIVAKWYTGSLNNWKAIAKVNPALDPNRIVIGSDIRIPADLLITRKPMPKSFLAGFDLEKKSKLPTPQTEPDKKGTQPDMVRPSEIPDQQIPPTVIPPAEPAIKPVPAVTGETPELPEKELLPLKSIPPQLEKKQIPSQTGRLAEPSDKPLPAAPSSQPKVEKKPTQPKAEIPIENDEPPLFGPKGYSN